MVSEYLTRPNKTRRLTQNKHHPKAEICVADAATLAILNDNAHAASGKPCHVRGRISDHRSSVDHIRGMAIQHHLDRRWHDSHRDVLVRLVARAGPDGHASLHH